MTNMRRATIAVSDQLDNAVLNLKKDDRFLRCSYSEIVRRALEIGLRSLADDAAKESPAEGEKGA